MKALCFPLWATLPLVLFFHASPSLALSPCDAPQVELRNNYIQIAPTGVDDTDTIQCALELAVERNIPEIRLTRGEFVISSLSVQNFSGTLQGGGKDFTRINILDQSVDCAAVRARGEATAAIKFIGGEPRIRWLTLSVDPLIWPCVTGGGYGGLDAMIHFTGRPGTPEACTADVIYGTIDRVNLEGPRISGGTETHVHGNIDGCGRQRRFHLHEQPARLRQDQPIVHQRFSDGGLAEITRKRAGQRAQ
jgi:hypothetical protein